MRATPVIANRSITPLQSFDDHGGSSHSNDSSHRHDHRLQALARARDFLALIRRSIRPRFLLNIGKRRRPRHRHNTDNSILVFMLIVSRVDSCHVN